MRIRIIYWAFRWTVALPIALSTTITYGGVWLFDTLFGVAKDFKAKTDWNELREIWLYLFTMKLHR
jgi:hypothetical protein